jgi:hypothetical protein
MDEATQQLCVQMMRSKLDAMRLMMDSPWYKASQIARRAEWDAKPWYEKARIRASVRLRNARIWLGEKIAGRSFDDYQ